MRLVLLAAALSFVTPARSQEAVPDSACTYATCALQIDQRLLSFRLVRSGEPLPNGGPLGLGPPPIAAAVSGSPAALMHARAYERDLRTSGWLVNGATALYFLGALDPFDLLSGGVEVGMAAGAAGLAVVSVPISFRARRSLNRAVDTYNEELRR
ncbi:hypothetical protein RQM47_15115 [Rubrivirga sp. S365]|uniref:Uncharacterized protein n=1 Tax=Rubrivirga litoralis TaxID=3075598 RepID=A0ABU3BT57_9BACT|nr:MULTISPECIES: hypothetical protein [unclassified Rubrivirga]MDT0632475.1 hypothetical protein [Rubrivirga sp. F394]MDT7857975.1 hypothetical protein [Rubrivirga sp. S365]